MIFNGMKLINLLIPAASLAAASPSPVLAGSSNYTEKLHLKPLPGGSLLYAGFNFVATTPSDAYQNQHFSYFPRSLAQILQFTNVAELHLRFALGRWDETNWGHRPRAGSREGGTGVELWAWLEADTPTEAEQRWADLVNSLSGFFCASLNFIDRTKTTQPVLSFHPEGVMYTSPRRLHSMHGMLPHEVICTENLTPFLKLLPCKGKAGISSLLDGHKVFDANWQTIAIDIRHVRSPDDAHLLEIEQTVDLVLDVERSMRPRDNPIPRPLPMERMTCNASKTYHADDTCYPGRSDWQDLEWSLSGIFGRPIQGSCPIGGRIKSTDVIIERPREQLSETSLDAPNGLGSSFEMAFELEAGHDFDLKIPKDWIFPDHRGSDQTSLQASRQITGYGQERGSMHTVMRNPHSHAVEVVYLDSLPWFLRPYLHTLHLEGATLGSMYCVPAIDRERGTTLEVMLTIPPNGTVNLSYDFEKAILRYTEYPPDANRGFDIASAVIKVSASPDRGSPRSYYIRTTSLLLPLPTPDFSMPYNVIILTSTVIALGFGSIFNLLVRRFGLQTETPPSRLGITVHRLRDKIRTAVEYASKFLGGSK